MIGRGEGGNSVRNKILGKERPRGSIETPGIGREIWRGAAIFHPHHRREVRK